MEPIEVEKILQDKFSEERDMDMPAPMPLKQNPREEVQSERSCNSQEEYENEEVPPKPKQF